MQIARDLKSTMGYPVCNWRVMELLILGPVVPDFWQMIDPHQHIEAKVCSYLLSICLPDIIITSALGCIAICLHHYKVKDIAIKE